MKRHYFNLIELMLALGVIVVGLVSVMALFPIGANANRDAMTENYSAMAAEQMLNSFAYFLRNPNSTPPDWNTKRSRIAEISSDTSIAVGEIRDQQEYFTDTTPCPFFTVGTNTIYMEDINNYQSGFRIDSVGQAGNKDFEAMMALWQEPIRINPPPAPPVDYDYGTVLNIEISWPAQLPYSRRQKARYRLEVFNPNR